MPLLSRDGLQREPGRGADMADEWRRVVATLADPVRRQVYASIVLGADGSVSGDSIIPQKKRGKAIADLIAAGLVADVAGTLVANGEIFRELLAQTPAVTREGIDRFIRNGRVERYPSKPGDRDEVLRWARDTAITSAEVLSEREFSDRLAELADDAVTLRRYLVDGGLVVRDADGQRYRLRE
jgi:hypothetical protein